MHLCVMTKNLMARTYCWQFENIDINIEIMKGEGKKRKKNTHLNTGGKVGLKELNKDRSDKTLVKKES